MFSDKTLKVEDVQTFDVYQDGELYFCQIVYITHLLFIVVLFYTMSGKRDQQYFLRNFDKFRELFILFGVNHPDIPCD